MRETDCERRENSRAKNETKPPAERRSDNLHVDLLSGQCGLPGRAFLGAGERRHKKALGLPQSGDEGWSVKVRHREDSTPILSLAGQSPGPHGPGLDERKKAGLLTSGSSYSFRLTAFAHSGLMELSSPVTAALPSRICTWFPILPRVEPGALFCGFGSARGGAAIKELLRGYGVARRRSSGKPY